MSIEESLASIAKSLAVIAASKGVAADDKVATTQKLQTVGEAKKEAAATKSAATQATAEKTLDYEKDVKPLFNKYCASAGIEAAQKYLAKRGYAKKLTEAKPAEYAEIVKELTGLLEVAA